MDEHAGLAALLRTERVRLWRALLIVAGSRELATEAADAAFGRVARAEIPARRPDLWSAAFEHLDGLHRSELHLVVGTIDDGSIGALSDRLSQLPPDDVRALIAHHVGDFEADDLLAFARRSDVAPAAAEWQGEPDRGPHADHADRADVVAASMLRRAERALGAIDDRPADVQFASIGEPLPQTPTTPAARVGPRRLAGLLIGVAVSCVAGVVALSLADDAGGDQAVDPAPVALPGAPPDEPDLVALPPPTPCRADIVRSIVSARPSALRSSFEGSLGEVHESTDGVVRGRLLAVRPSDGWVSFDVADGRAVDGLVGEATTGFTMPGRMPRDVDAGLDFVAFVSRDPESPAGWSAPVRGGVWVACPGEDAVPLGDPTPVDDRWVTDPTLAVIETAVTARRAQQQTVTLTPIDAVSVGGGFRLRDGTGMSVRLPLAIGDAVLDVESSGEGSVSLRGPGVSVDVSFDPCPAPVAAARRAGSDTVGDCRSDADVALTTDVRLGPGDDRYVEGFVVGRGDTRQGTILRAAPNGDLVAIDASTLLVRWRSAGDTRPVGLVDGVAVAAVGDDLVGFGVDDGGLRWTKRGSGSAGIARADGSWLLSSATGAALSAIDPVTGDERWRIEAPSGVRWGSPTPSAGVGVLAEWSDVGASRLIGVDLASGDRRWSLELGDGGERAPRFAVDQDRGLVVVLDADDRLMRVDAADGRRRWQTQPIRGASIEGIWPNSATLRASGRTITVGLTEGFLLPP